MPPPIPLDPQPVLVGALGNCNYETLLDFHGKASNNSHGRQGVLKYYLAMLTHMPYLIPS